MEFNLNFSLSSSSPNLLVTISQRFFFLVMGWICFPLAFKRRGGIMNERLWNDESGDSAECQKRRNLDGIAGYSGLEWPGFLVSTSNFLSSTSSIFYNVSPPTSWTICCTNFLAVVTFSPNWKSCGSSLLCCTTFSQYPLFFSSIILYFNPNAPFHEREDAHEIGHLYRHLSL